MREKSLAQILSILKSEVKQILPSASDLFSLPSFTSWWLVITSLSFSSSHLLSSSVWLSFWSFCHELTFSFTLTVSPNPLILLSAPFLSVYTTNYASLLIDLFLTTWEAEKLVSAQIKKLLWATFFLDFWPIGQLFLFVNNQQTKTKITKHLRTSLLIIGL